MDQLRTGKIKETKGKDPNTFVKFHNRLVELVMLFRWERGAFGFATISRMIKSDADVHIYIRFFHHHRCDVIFSH